MLFPSYYLVAEVHFAQTEVPLAQQEVPRSARNGPKPPGRTRLFRSDFEGGERAHSLQNHFELASSYWRNGKRGMFRISCEHVIKTMRKGRETLLTLLEAFVYDPLVDWTTSNEGGYTGAFYGGGQTAVSGVEGHQTKKDMERDITQSMFSIRIAEMKAAWLTNREEMLACVPRLQEAVMAYFKVEQDQVETRAALEQLRQQLAYTDSALTDTTHAAYSLHHRYDEFVVVRAARQDAESGIQEKLNECEQWHSTHKYALSVVQGPHLQKLCADVTVSLSTSLPGFCSVVDFLQGAGQAHLISQCESMESELQLILHQRRAVLHSCLDVLHTYATIVSQFPPSYVAENRASRWQHWLQTLICDFTLQQCKDIVSEFQDQYALTASPHLATPNVLSTETKMTAMVSEGNVRLLKVMERRGVEPSDTSRLTLHVQETTSSVHQYLHDHGLAGVMCMTSVVVSALCSLSKRYLVMEGAAAAASDRLMDLTSREGDWFLEELGSMSGNVCNLLHLVTHNSMLPLLSDDVCQRLSGAMTSVHAIYVSLQDLYVNFRSIIVPEAAKTLSRGDTSVAASISALDRLVEEAHRPLETLMTQLETQLRNTALGNEVDQEPVSTAKRLRALFNALLQGEVVHAEGALTLTPGQMLLMGFNGLFTRLDADFSAMLDMTGALDLPDTWRKVDVIREARGLQSVALTEQNLSLLSQLFFIKQLRAMVDFFHMCNTSVTTLNSVTGGSLYDDEQLSRPIKHFIAEYVRKHLIGLPSQTLGHILCVTVTALHVDVTAEIELHDIGAESKVSMEALCKKAVDTNLKNGAFEHRHLTHASTLLGTVDIAWRKSDLARRLDSNITLLKGSVQRSQMAVSRFYWLHEDVFVKAGHVPTAVYMPTHSSIMAELTKNVQTLVSHEAVVVGIKERYTGLEASITQRLKWAAGANPSLLQVLQQFEEALSARTVLIQNENTLAGEVTSVCNSILHFEALRTRSPEAVTADTSFLQLINRCEESCVLLESCSTSVCETEEALYSIKPLCPGEVVTSQWLSVVKQNVVVATADLQGKADKMETSAETTKDGVKQRVAAIRGVLSMHHKLMSDIRSILKSMAKQEEYDYGPEPVPGGIREYVNKYKCFSESFTTMLKLVMSEDLAPGTSAEITSTMKALTEQILVIYDDLVGFASLLTLHPPEEDQEQANFATALKKQFEAFPPMSPRKTSLVPKPGERLGTPPTRTASPTSGARLGTPPIKRPDKVSRDPRTGKAVQERNSYAVGVWRRVKLKLDGRDPDLNKRFSVAEQVDFVIREATNLDNLAVLYEGWTPWV